MKFQTEVTPECMSEMLDIPESSYFVFYHLISCIEVTFHRTKYFVILDNQNVRSNSIVRSYVSSLVNSM